jgi:hypothetical protein
MIVGLTGRKQAGKNTVAALLNIYSPLPVVEVSFAALLKKSAAAVLGVAVEDLERWKNDAGALVSAVGPSREGGGDTWHSQTVREFLQRFGTEGHRDLMGPDFWVNAALPQSRDYRDGKLYVVTDVRFANEAARVTDLGGSIYRVLGPTEVEGAGDEHASEKPLASHWVSGIIDNRRRDAVFVALKAEVKEFVQLELGLVPQAL